MSHFMNLPVQKWEQIGAEILIFTHFFGFPGLQSDGKERAIPLESNIYVQHQLSVI